MSIEEKLDRILQTVEPLQNEIAELKHQLGLGFISREEAMQKYDVPGWKVSGWINSGALKNHGSPKKQKYIESEFRSLAKKNTPA